MASPFEQLLEIERECKQKAAGLPITDDVKQVWTGIGFRIGDTVLVTPMDDVAEIMHPPSYTQIPGVRSWMVGIANVRGNLLPLVDLKGFVTGQDLTRRKAGRVLVAKHGGGWETGLYVDEVLGLKHFYMDEREYELPELSANFQPYIAMAFRHDEEHWPVFSFKKLAKQERFSQVTI